MNHGSCHLLWLLYVNIYLSAGGKYVGTISDSKYHRLFNVPGTLYEKTTDECCGGIRTRTTINFASANRIRGL